MYVLNAINPESLNYNITFALKIAGKFDFEHCEGFSIYSEIYSYSKM